MRQPEIISTSYIKRDSAEKQCAATTMRRALLLYALICHKAIAQDTYASLRRAARQSYGFGDARRSDA